MQSIIKSASCRNASWLRGFVYKYLKASLKRGSGFRTTRWTWRWGEGFLLKTAGLHESLLTKHWDSITPLVLGSWYFGATFATPEQSDYRILLWGIKYNFFIGREWLLKVMTGLHCEPWEWAGPCPRGILTQDWTQWIVRWCWGDA